MTTCSPSDLHVTCLCAAWCRACEAYRPLFESTVTGLGLPGRWVDVEDEADRLGDLDIETFPTLLIYDAQRLLFAGPVMPDANTLQRLVRYAVESPTPEAEGTYAEGLAWLRGLTDGPEAG